VKAVNALWTCALLVTSAPAAAAGDRPVVVELFTSQGCSSCPPANANLITLSRRPDVLALSFGVTYWDQLGWKDVFARPDYTARQATYEPRLGRSGPFTPQMVVNGRADAIGNRLAEVEELIARARTDRGPDLVLSPGSVRIGAHAPPPAPADVWLVRYEPNIIAVPVGRGENTGRTLPHARVVRDLARIGAWAGSETVLPVPPAPSGLRTAILVQSTAGGPILAAASD
jgi:hypothetical protein